MPPQRDHAQARAPMAGLVEEEDRLPRRPLQWLGLMIAAAVVGASVGLLGAAFRLTLGWLDAQREALLSFAHASLPPSIGWALPVVLCMLGAGAGCWLTQRLAPQTAGSGIPRVEAVLRTHLHPAGANILPVKFVGGALSIGSGLALGREGPTVQMGGTVGRLFALLLRRLSDEPWTLIAAGAGAGLAVAFNAPLSGALFVMEELVHRFSARIFSATLVACIAGTIVLRALLGGAPDFVVAPLAATSADVLPEYLLLGVVAGFAGVAFNLALVRSLRLFERASHWPRGAKGALVGAGAGLLAWFLPQLVGGGENIAQLALSGKIAWSAIAGVLCLRFFLSIASYGSGAPGGIFAPLLALGALLGSGFASANTGLRGVPFAPATSAIVAMAACFTAVVRSPLTGVVLLLEMTGGWALILPMMAASVTAYAVPELLGNPPIYDTLRQRDEALERAQAAEPAAGLRGRLSAP